jgi:hypothetical protein
MESIEENEKMLWVKFSKYTGLKLAGKDWMKVEGEYCEVGQLNEEVIVGGQDGGTLVEG